MFFVSLSAFMAWGGRNEKKINAGYSISDYMPNGNGNAHYIVWMYPFPPPNYEEEDDWTMPRDQILICPYSRSACNGKGKTVNMAELTKDTLYHSYILDHPYHKLRHMQDFCHHIQVIAMISLLMKNRGAFDLNFSQNSHDS